MNMEFESTAMGVESDITLARTSPVELLEDESDEGTFWKMEAAETFSLNSMADTTPRWQAELGSGREKMDESESKEMFSTLIPGLPVDLAESCLARVPWIWLPKMMTVCKSWAAYLMSDSNFALRRQLRTSESLMVVLSVPVRLGPLRLTVFDATAATNLEWHKPLAVFDYLGKWSGFLRGFRCAVVGPDLFIIGGRHDGLQYATGKSVTRFNFLTRKWTEAAPMHSARRDFACAVIDGKVYVAGGTASTRVLPQGHGTMSALNSAEVYDYKRDEWHELPPLEKARVGCLGVALDDRFYVIGGGTDNGTFNFELYRSAEIFDTGMCEWKTVEDMWQSEVKLPRAVAGFDHSLFAVDSNDKTLKSYDEEANHWSNVMSMPFSNTILPGRDGHAERQQAMGGLPGDQLIDLPRQGLFWMGPCSYLSRAHHLLKLRLSGSRRGWSGNVALADDNESPSKEFKSLGKRSCLIIASGIVYV